MAARVFERSSSIFGDKYRFSPMKILVCEDHEVEMKVLQVALKSLPVEAVYTIDGYRAMEQLRSGTSFDMVITDIHMPYHNGDEILSVVREELGKKIPVIMVSSDTEEEVISLALKSGVNEFIRKPLSPEKILSVLKKYMK